MTPLPPDIQAALDRLEPAIRQAFLDAVDQITSQAQLASLEDAIRAGDWARAVAVLRLDGTFWGPLDRSIEQAFYAGGVLALAGLPKIPDPFPGAGSSSASTDDTRGQRSGFAGIRRT